MQHEWFVACANLDLVLPRILNCIVEIAFGRAWAIIVLINEVWDALGMVMLLLTEAETYLDMTEKQMGVLVCEPVRFLAYKCRQ